MAGWMGSRSSNMIWTCGIYNALKKVDKEIAKSKKERSISLTPSASRCSSTPVSTYRTPFTVDRIETSLWEKDDAEHELDERSQKIYYFLKDANKPMTAEKIAEQLELPKPSVAGLLSRMYKKGLVEKTKAYYDEATGDYKFLKVSAFSVVE